jgi:phage regulator Rha-like protein
MDKHLAKIRKGSIEQLIFLLRGQKVMLSPNLAELYGVKTRVLVQAVKRNIDRFPDDFMFQLTDEEFADLKSQIVISSWGGSRRAKPYAFTEQGVAMLSSVLKSKRAVQVNIEFMRTFVRIRAVLTSNRNLAAKLKELEGHIQDHDEKIEIIFEAILQLLTIPEETKNPIGFEIKEPEAKYKEKGKR